MDDLGALMSRFRLASRDLFNHFFQTPDPWANSDVAWARESRFSAVEELLFQKLVLEAVRLPGARYKELQPSIGVELRGSDFAPIMVNREIDCGYWDYPIREVTTDAEMLFIQFFDWDVLSYRDNQYVRVSISGWPSQPAAIGKHALVEAQYVRFALRS